LKLIISFLILFFSITAFAAGGGSEGVPVDFIKLQVINFAVFVALIAMLIKFKVNPVLANQKEEYISKANEAARKLEESKAKRDELKKKLADLKKDYDKNIQEAQEQSLKRKKAHISAAKEASLRMNKDLEHQINTMKQVYWSRLKENLFESSVVELRKEVEEKIDPVAIEQLQKSFVERMDVRI
jgi:F0F1-type ATP synthase membrane subunit b/b'